MNRTWLLILGNFLIALILIFLIELISFLILQLNSHEIPFLLNLNTTPARQFDEHNDAEEIHGYHQIDPLTGWSETDDDSRKKGYAVEHGCIVLRTGTDTSSVLNILITGGSTSDLNYQSKNWPVHLAKLLHENKVNATVYVGAVTGYNSGQELLKLIRDGLETRPTVHISYSGANEVNNSRYVSVYEQNFFRHSIANSFYPILLPNTIFLLRKLLKKNQDYVSLLPIKEMSPEIFWQRNMQIMQGIAYSYHYHFIGVLQPVVGSGNYSQSVPEEFSSNVVRYRKFYPDAKKIVKESDCLTDLSAIFDTAKGRVYLDQCHLDSVYQKVIAMSIYEMLEKRNLLGLR